MVGRPPFNELTLYTAATPNGLKPCIVLEELGLSYKSETLDIFSPTIKEPWYTAINPNGRIPALKDGEMRVFESGAIMLYLADHYDTDGKVSYKRDTAEHYEMLSWLMFQMAGVGPMQGQAHHFCVMAGVCSAYGQKRYMDETRRLYDVLEARLAVSEWLAGAKYTLADIASYTWIRIAPGVLGMDLSPWPWIVKWIAKIDARPAVQKAKKVPVSSRSEEEVFQNFARLRAKVDGLKDTDKHES